MEQNEIKGHPFFIAYSTSNVGTENDSIDVIQDKKDDEEKSSDQAKAQGASGIH